MFQQAFDHYQNGRLVEAERLCVDILRRSPKDFDATDLLAMIFYRTGRAAEALMLLDRAVSLKDDAPTTHNNRGIVLSELGRSHDALASYDRALMLVPTFAEAHNNRGGVLAAQKNYAEALAAFDRAVELKPDFAAAHANRGRVLSLMGRNEEALSAYDRALAFIPNDQKNLQGRGNVLLALGRHEEAVDAYSAALAAAPGAAEAYGNRGNALMALRRRKEALADFERMAALKPTSPEAHINLGHALRLLGRPAESIASLDRAIALNPALPKAYTERGTAYADLLRHDEALRDFMHATALKPDFVAAHWNEALCRLQLGQFKQGWPMYEWRWSYGDQNADGVGALQKRWTGEDVSGKTVVLRSEQGLGDTIQFCRFAQSVSARGARVILAAQKPLIPVLSSLGGIDRVVAMGEPLPAFDYDCPLLSLPWSLGTEIDTIPSAQGYLRSDPARVETWRERLGLKTRLRIGLVWSGNPNHKHDYNRSVPLQILTPLFTLKADWAVLQTEIRPADAAFLRNHGELRDLSRDISDFADTAALIDLMDLVIAVDTSVAHLAGALGKPVWIMLAYNPDWRWLLDRADSPWYRSARLFRQPAAGDWPGVVADVANNLQTLIGK